MKSLNDRGEVYRLGKAGEDVTYALRKEKPDFDGSSGYLYAVANVRQKDGSLQRVQLLFDEEFATNHAACMKMAEEVVMSLTPGGGVLPLDARVQSLPSYEVGKRYEVDVPKGMYTICRRETVFILRCSRRCAVPEATIGVV